MKGGRKNLYTEQELARILSEYGKSVYRLAFIKTKNYSDADDIYQEVFLRLIKNDKEFKSDEYLKNWLLKTTINLCKDLWKSAWYRNNSLLSDFQEDSGYEYESVNEKDDESSEVTNAVMQLPQKYREVIHLYYYEGYTEKEIAQMLNTNEKTISSRMIRGRKKLKELFEKEGKKYEF